MFELLREDYQVHGSSLRNRAFWAMAHYRFGRWVYRLPAPLRWLGGKIYGLLAVFWPILTGVAIDRNLEIGRRFHIIHAGMIIISAKARIGQRVGVMHGVTIGANMQGGVPTIGDDVFIGTHATIVGPIHVGDGAQVAANSLVIADVPPGMLAMGVPAKNYPILSRPPAGRGATAEAPVTANSAPPATTSAPSA